MLSAPTSQEENYKPVLSLVPLSEFEKEEFVKEEFEQVNL